MDDNQTKAFAQAGELAQLVSPTNKVFIVRLEPGGDFHTHRGILRFDELIGQPWGSEVQTHTGAVYYMLQPSLSDIIQDLRRNTQIMYPKDIGYTLITMGIGPGVQVLEAGTGSGALTIALAWSVGPQGQVYSYDVRPEMQNLARKNVEKLGLSDRVQFKLRDISEGFDERNLDALFLDLPNPYDYLGQVRQALKPGGRFATILPTTNQVIKLLDALYKFEFAFIDVCEVMLRYYKPVADRFRPTDRMVAHTGFLIFARPMLEIAKLHRRPVEESEVEEETAETGEESTGGEEASDVS
jgi:tRNA (adenine57-N1/adenine58-N1)-methyltransferase catalytic subunit